MFLTRPRVLFGLVSCASLLRSPASCAFSMSSSQIMNPEKFLFYDYETRGKEVTTTENLSLYCTGKSGSKNGVLVIPDSFGWNGGRVRNIADYFGENKCLAVVPSIIGMSMGTEGVNFMESPSLRDYFKSVTFDGGIKPRICSAINFMRSEGVEKIAIIGFSWGGWVVTNILASDLADNFVCGALPHPSIDLEERLFGGSVVELMSRINRPVLLMPSQSDPDRYVELMHLLKYKLPSSDVISYNHISGNFLHRGSTSIPEVKEASEQALSQIMSFFNEHFQMDANQLVSQSVKGGFTREYSHPKSVYERSKETGEHLAQRVQQSASDIGDRTKQTYDSTKETAQQTGESLVERLQHAGQYVAEQARSTFDYVKGGVGSAGESAQETREYLGDQAQQTYEKTKENVNVAAEKTKESGQSIGEQAKQTYEKAKETVLQTGEKVGEQAQQTYDWTKEGASNLAERAKQTGQQAGEQAQQTYDKTKEGASNLAERAKQTGQEAGEQAQQTYDKGKDMAQQTYDKAKDSAGKTRQQVGEQAQQAYDKTKEGTQQAREGAQQSYDRTKEQAKQTGQQVGEQAQETYDKTKHEASKMSERAKDSASETGKQVGEKTKQAGEEIKQRSERGNNKK